MRDRLDGVAVFVEAVEAGSFAGAAARLALSRSAIGKTIARLEARLGVRLFHRTTRTQSLTEEGHAYHERCLKALEELRAGEAVLESGRREVAGRLRVSVPVLFGRYCVAPILLDLARRHPKLTLDLNFSDRPVDLIEDGYDLAVRNGSLRDAGELVTRGLAVQRMVVCAAPAYLAARGVPRSVVDIAHHDAVTYWRADHVRSWLVPGTDGRHVTVAPKSRVRLDDLEAIADAATAGMGLVWLPCWLVGARIRSGALVPVLDDRPGIAIETHALWPKTPRLPLRIRLAIDALVTELPGLVDP
ncbi:MAG TPA: LysR family transcriptional regulator [Aliidongia sp.]|uniref:LysR family transcriptional regulator n=1 Tax=Aliidongia sp. TaxID=1914230 RepID=UPI002DDD88F9|nr:LysR family transcriptional regulator [Aliidongia sp.]HEV2675183.1 LysR family transcriptional regulator [Aliidongia sp.]